MKRTFTILILFFAFTVVGCATEFLGTKPGSGQTEFSRDFTECQAQSSKVHGYMDKYFVKACMQGKGWNMTKP